MLKSHHNVTYLINRTLNFIWYSLNPGTPWLSRQAIKRLEMLLNKNQVMVETGSGRSTVWFAERVNKLISVEHYKPWYDKVSQQLINIDIKNVEYIYASDKGADGPLSSPYVQKIVELEDQSVDVLLIDGVHRAEIASIGLTKIRPGGLIILDNAERYVWVETSSPESIREKKQPDSIWLTFVENTKHFRKETYTDGITATLLIFT